MAEVTKENIRDFQNKHLAWYKKNGRTFPWRSNGLSSYKLVIAETLLQRTKAETVSRFYEQFLIDFPNWQSLANAELSKIEEYLRPIGLFKQRATRLKNLAIEMVKRKGILPIDRLELECIPFMGQYIANAVELLIHHKPSPLIDVNMARVLERYFGYREMADIRYDPYLQDLSNEIVNNKNSKKLNWAILDFAAIICKARIPKCNECFLIEKCRYFISIKNV